MEVHISSQERKDLYNKAFKFLPDSRRIIIWLCLSAMLILSISLIRVNTNYFSMRLEDNPNKIIGLIALFFVVVVSLLMLMLPLFAMSRLKRCLPAKTRVHVSEGEIKVNQISVSKKDVTEILNLGNFLFAVSNCNGKYRYVIVHFQTEIKQKILWLLDEYKYPKIRQINSYREFPWIQKNK